MTLAAQVACVVMTLLLAAPLARAQSLAEIARREAVRRSRLHEHGWVYTDDLLEPTPAHAEVSIDADGSGESAPEPDAPADPTPPAAADESMAPQWRARAAPLHDRIGRLTASRIKLEGRLREVRRLTDGRRLDEAPAAFRETERLLGALSAIDRDLTFLAAARTRLEEAAARAEIPAEWIAPAAGPGR